MVCRRARGRHPRREAHPDPGSVEKPYSTRAPPARHARPPNPPETLGAAPARKETPTDHNSSSSSLEYMEPIWPRLLDLHLNTVLAPVSWELVEPEEGRFDFALVDGLVEGARRHDLRLVFLWFGNWKNGRSSNAPAWVRSDDERFPRARVEVRLERCRLYRFDWRIRSRSLLTRTGPNARRSRSRASPSIARPGSA